MSNIFPDEYMGDGLSVNPEDPVNKLNLDSLDFLDNDQPNEDIISEVTASEQQKEFKTIEGTLDEKARFFGFDLNASFDSILPIVFNLRTKLLESLSKQKESSFNLKELFSNTDFSNLINEKNIYDFTHVLDEMLRFLVDREISKRKIQTDLFNLIATQLAKFDSELPEEASLKPIIHSTILEMSQNISHKEFHVLREIIRKIWHQILLELAKDFSGNNEAVLVRLEKEIPFAQIIKSNKLFFTKNKEGELEFDLFAD